MYKQLAILIVHFHLSRIEEMPCQHWTFMRLRDYNVQKFRNSAKMNFPDKTSIKFIFSRFFEKNFSRYFPYKNDIKIFSKEQTNNVHFLSVFSKNFFRRYTYEQDYRCSTLSLIS